MAGIYVHIPYCRQACHYCNFHFSTSLQGRTNMIAAIAEEVVLTKDYLPAQPLDSVYFGGGTPSLLTAAEWDMIWNALLQHYTLSDAVEVTVEANPDDITPAWLSMLSQTPANRLSIGIQSFHDDELRMMNRLHTAAEASYAVKAAQDAGYHNITIDLMYGLPESTLQSWVVNLEQALSLQTTHLSSYSLTVEPKTALAHMVQTGKLTPVEDAVAAAQFLLLHERLTTAGMEHYEISNFALPGYRAIHNSAYWSGKPYLGLGPGAHSFQAQSRQWNISHNQQYIRTIQKKELPQEREWLSIEDRFNEWVMIRLRTAEGLSTTDVSTRFGEPIARHLQEMAQPLLQTGQLVADGDNIRIPIAHWYVADSIISDLFIA